MPVNKLQRRQEIIDRIKILCNATGKAVSDADISIKVRDLTCKDDESDGDQMLRAWDGENVNPDLIAGFIYANLDKTAANIKDAQRIGDVGVDGGMVNEFTDKFANVGGVDYRENARFMTISGYNGAAQGLNTYLDNDLYKDGVGNLDWSKQLPQLKRFAVANSVFTGDFANAGAAQNFYNNLSQLNTGDCDSTYSIRKTLVASALLKEGLSVKQSELVLKHLDNFFASSDEKLALTPERLQAYASTMKAVIDEIGIHDKKKLNQVNDELLDLLRSNKIKDTSVTKFNRYNSNDKKSIVLKGYLKDACEELDNDSAGAIRNYDDLAKKIGERYKKQIDAFKDRLSERNDLDPSLKALVLSDDFLKIGDVAKNLSKGQIESLEKLDSASFRSIVSLLNTVSKKPGRVTNAYNITAENLTKCINTLFGQGNEVTSDTISKNFSNAFSKASEKIITGTLQGNKYLCGVNDVEIVDVSDYVPPQAGVPGRCGVDKINDYINTVASNSHLGAEAQADLKTFLRNMAHYDPSMIVGKNAEKTLTLFNTFDCSSEMVSFLKTYKQAVQNGVSKDKIEEFYTTFNQINLAATEGKEQIATAEGAGGNILHQISAKGTLIKQYKQQTKNYLETQNGILSYSIEQEIKKNKQADKELDESNAEEEAKEKQKIKDVKIVDEALKNRSTGNSELTKTYELHKSCLEDKDGQINDAYAAGLLAFTHSKDTTYEDTVTILKNIYDKIKDEEDKKDILSNIVSSGGLIVYKDILKNDDLSPTLLRKMAVDLSNDEKITKTLDKTAQENLEGTLCEGKEGTPCKDVRSGQEIGKEYEFTKTEWISYMAENGSKIKSKDYEFADMNEEQKKAFKKACLYLSPKLLEQEAVCAAISKNITTIKDDPEFFIHAINETYSKRNREDKKTTLETVTDIVNRTNAQRGNILSKMTQEDFLELKGDAVWNVVKDNTYTTKMIDYAAGATPEKKENRRLYNSIVANSNDSTIFTDSGNKPAAAGGAAAGEIGYDGLKLNDYLSNCENLSQKQTATNEIIRAINNYEDNFFTKPDGSFYNREEYAWAIYNDISRNSHLNIKLKARKTASTYQAEVERAFVWKNIHGNLLVADDKLNSDTEIKLIQKLSRLNATDRNNAIQYLQNITDEYKATKDTKSRDEFLSNVVRDLSRVKRPTTLDFKKAALKSMLTMKGVSKADQELLFENEERVSFFLENYKMFLSIDKEEFTQIFKKSPDPVKNGRAIDTIVEVAKDYGKTPLKREFIIRSAAYLSADSVINHFEKCIKIQLNNDPIFKKQKFSDIYNDKIGQYEGELALEKARYMNLVYVADHSYPPLEPLGSIYLDIKDDVEDTHSLTRMKLINKDLALLVNTTQTGKKYDKVLNKRKDIQKFIKNYKRDTTSNSLECITESINHFVYDGKDEKSAKEFAKALMGHVKEKRDAATLAAPYNKGNVKLNLQANFLDTNPQYIAINNALRGAGADTLEKRKLEKQLQKLTDLAELYVKHDDEPAKLAHTLGNGMTLAVHNNFYDTGTNKMKTTNAAEIQNTIRFAAYNSSTYALTSIHDMGNDVMTVSLLGLDNTDYFKDDSKTYTEIAGAIDSKHAEAKNKEVKGKSTDARDRAITHDELYKIEGLETFLVYTYNRARARALGAGMTPEEADFRAMAMTQAMDRKILNDDDFRKQLEKQIKEEEKQKINLLMLGYVEGKAGDIYGAAATKDAVGMNTAIGNQITHVDAGVYPVLNSIVNEAAPNNKAKTVLDTTVNELKTEVSTHLGVGIFASGADFKTFVNERQDVAKKSLLDTRSQLENLCMDQLDVIEKEFEYEKISRAQSVIAATSLSSDYKYNTACGTMVVNHVSKLDNFSDEDLQNFGIACNALVLDSSALYGNTTAANNKEAALKTVGEKADKALQKGFAMSTLENVAHTIATATFMFSSDKSARNTTYNRIKELATSTKGAREKNFSSDAITDVVSAIANPKERKEAFEWYEVVGLSRNASNRIDKFADTTVNLITAGGNVDQIKHLATAIKIAKNNGVKKEELLQVKDVQDAINEITGHDIERDAFVSAIKDVYGLCKGNTIENIVHTISNAAAGADAADAADAIKNISACAFNVNTSNYGEYSADTTIDVASTVCRAYDTAVAPTTPADAADAAVTAMNDFAENVKNSADMTGGWEIANFGRKWIMQRDEEKLDRGINEHHIISIVNSSAIKPSFEKIESPQTLAKVSKLIADEVKKGKNTSIVGDTETQTKLLLLLAADSKSDALDTLAKDGSIKDESALSSLCSKDFKKLNKKQKTLLLKKINTNKLDDFTQNLIVQGIVEPLELYDILKNNEELKKNSKGTLNTLDNLNDVDIITYKAIENCKTKDGVIEQVAAGITYDENKAATDNNIILYEKAGQKIRELSSKGADFGKEFASLINDYGKTDADRDEKYEQEVKQKLAYAFVFANDYKEGLKLAKSYEDLLDNLEPDNKQYVFNALLEKECGNPHKSYDVTAEDFVNKILEVDEILTKQEDKDLFVQTVKNYVSMIENDSQKVADIFTNLCNSDSKNAPLYVAALLNDQIELSKSKKIEITNAPFNKHTSYGVEHHMPDTGEIISNAINRISVGTSDQKSIEITAKNFYTLVKSIPDTENKGLVMNGIMSYIESLDTVENQAKLSISLAKMFTKNMKTEEDEKLCDQLLTNMARNFAGNEELFVEIMNRLDTNKPQEEILQAELFYKYSKYADSTSTQYIYDNSSVKNNEKLEKKYYRTSDGSYSKKNNRDISDILSDIGVTEQEDRERIINQLKRCANASAVARVLNGFIEEHNKLAETEGRDKIDTINEQDMKKISKQIMIKRKDLLKGLISGDEKIFEGSSVVLDTVEKYAKNMENDDYKQQYQNSITKGELLKAVSKMRKREETFRRKADAIKSCKELNYKRALTAADFLSKMNCANKIITDFETKSKNGYCPTELEKMRYEAAKMKKRELLRQKYDFTQSNRHWYNGKTLGKRMWNSVCKGADYLGQYAFGHLSGSIIKFIMVSSPLAAGGAISYFAFAGAALLSGGLGVAAVISASILSIALCVAAGYAAYRIHNSNLCRHVNHWPDYWRDKALKIKEEKLMEKAEATLKKSNHALIVLDGKQIKKLDIQDLSDRKTTEQVNVNYIDEKNMTLRSKRLRGIRGTRFIGINDFAGEDGIEHTFRKGTIRRTNDMNASENFADMKLKKYDKDMMAIMKAFVNIKAADLHENSELPPLPTIEKKNDMEVSTNKLKTSQITR